MKRDLDKVDVLIAFGAFVFLACLSFLWAYPYPHPDLWPYLSTLRHFLSLSVLAALGHFALGLFAAALYLAIRLVWFQNLPDSDDYPDRFLFARLGPLVGAFVYSLFPTIWRGAQFLSPAFLFLLLELSGVVLWLWGRGCRSLLGYSFSYFLFGFVSAINPLAAGFLLYAVFSDIINQWNVRQLVRQRDDDSMVCVLQFQEKFFSVGSAIVGVVAAAAMVARYVAFDGFVIDIPRNAMAWYSTWVSNLDQAVTSPMMLTLAGIILSCAAGIAFARRIRAVGAAGFVMAASSVALVGFVCLLLIIRAWDGEARDCLSIIRDFVRQTVEDTKNVRWLFSDGRLDDMLRYEMAKARSKTKILNVMHAPTPTEGKALMRYAPEVGERGLFEAGGAEVFKAWVRERPDRLAESAWLMGGGLLRMFGKVEQQSYGTVLRVKASPEEAKAYEEADARLAVMLDRVHAKIVQPSLSRRTFGRVDRALGEKYDAILWRVGRLAVVQSDQYAAVGDAQKAQKLREKIQTLNAGNRSLAVQGSMLERMLPTVNLVVTSREGLDIALKRADFTLAQRYAREVLVSEPEDPSAHFALGMIGLKAKDYFEASRHFERVIKFKPNEPAALNNLAVCYLRLGLTVKAKELVERAREVYPNSKPIEETFKEISEAIKKMAKE